MERKQQLRPPKDDIAPAKKALAARAVPRGRRFTREDSLWNIVGMFKDDDGPTDVSANKHEYLADAYAPKPR